MKTVTWRQALKDAYDFAKIAAIVVYVSVAFILITGLGELLWAMW